MLQYEIYFSPSGLRSACGIRLDGCKEGLKSLCGVVEIGDGFNQLVGGKVGKVALKFTKAHARLVEVTGILDLIVGGAAVHKKVRAPSSSVGSGVEIGSVACLNESKHTALGILSASAELSRDMLGDKAYVIHKSRRILKSEGVDPLKNVL